MLNFTFHNPTKLVFGRDTIQTIGKHLSHEGITNILLLYGKNSIKQNGVYDTVTASLKAHNIDFTELGGVKPNPVLSKVQEGIDLVKKHSLTAILSVGGGSTLDSAKAIAAGSVLDGDVWDFYSGTRIIEAALPIFAVLTLSATGSEMNGNSVLTNEAEDKKWAFSSPFTYPKVSILDPFIQKTLPAIQTANGAIDAISHVFEAYFGGTPQVDMVDSLCEGIVKTIIKHTPILLQDPTNYDSRAELAWAATLALNGLTGVGRAGDWSSHGIEHALSIFNDIAHGSGLAIIMPAWMDYVYKHDIPQFAKAATNIFGITEDTPDETARKGIQALRNFYQSIGAPITLTEVGITKENLAQIADNASLTAPMGSLVSLGHDAIYEILKLAL